MTPEEGLLLLLLCWCCWGPCPFLSPSRCLGWVGAATQPARKQREHTSRLSVRLGFAGLDRMIGAFAGSRQPRPPSPLQLDFGRFQQETRA